MRSEFLFTLVLNTFDGTVFPLISSRVFPMGYTVSRVQSLMTGTQSASVWVTGERFPFRWQVVQWVTWRLPHDVTRDASQGFCLPVVDTSSCFSLFERRRPEKWNACFHPPSSRNTKMSFQFLGWGSVMQASEHMLSDVNRLVINLAAKSESTEWEVEDLMCKIQRSNSPVISSRIRQHTLCSLLCRCAWHPTLVCLLLVGFPASRITRRLRFACFSLLLLIHCWFSVCFRRIWLPVHANEFLNQFVSNDCSGACCHPC